VYSAAGGRVGLDGGLSGALKLDGGRGGSERAEGEECDEDEEDDGEEGAAVARECKGTTSKECWNRERQLVGLVSGRARTTTGPPLEEHEAGLGRMDGSQRCSSSSTVDS